MSDTEPCWACGAVAAPTDSLAPHRFLACSECGLRFRGGIGQTSVRAIYEEDRYGGHHDVYAGERHEDDRRREAQRRLRYAARGVAPATLLDVGAAGGVFVAVARAHGWRAEGLEPMPSFVAHARRVHGVDLRNGTVESFDAPAGSLSLVTMWHVLEHVVRPAPQLRKVRTWLAENGRLAVEVPNAGAAIARALGPRWAAAQPEVHVAQFTPAALEALLATSGFEDVRVSTARGSRYYSMRDRLSPGNVAHLAKWGWRRGGGELLLATARAS